MTLRERQAREYAAEHAASDGWMNTCLVVFMRHHRDQPSPKLSIVNAGGGNWRGGATNDRPENVLVNVQRSDQFIVTQLDLVKLVRDLEAEVKRLRGLVREQEEA